MSDKHFTLTISQSKSDPGDWAIDYKSEDDPQTLLVHMKFTNKPFFDEEWFDEQVGQLARSMGERIKDHHLESHTKIGDLISAKTARKLTDKVRCKKSRDVQNGDEKTWKATRQIIKKCRRRNDGMVSKIALLFVGSCLGGGMAIQSLEVKEKEPVPLFGTSNTLYPLRRKEWLDSKLKTGSLEKGRKVRMVKRKKGEFLLLAGLSTALGSDYVVRRSLPQAGNRKPWLRKKKGRS